VAGVGLQAKQQTGSTRLRLYRSDGSNVDLCRRYDAEWGKCVVLLGTGGVKLASVDELSQKLTAEFLNA
jgi:hypothetical protein